MNSLRQWLPALALVLVWTAFSAPATAQSGDETAAPAAPTPCSSPEASQFDFWLGDWYLTWGKGGEGTNTITELFGDCGVQEDFAGQMPTGMYFGHSVSMYDVPAGKWKQTWVDSQGGYLQFEGGIEGDTMVLYGAGTQPDGTPFRTRMTFMNITDDNFDWHWERSTDDGTTWTLQWNIHYERIVNGR